MHSRAAILCLVAAELLSGCAARAPRRRADVPGPLLFEDRQPGSGIDFPLREDPGRDLGIKDTNGHPAALLDADGDGRLDVLLAGPDRVTLFHNDGDWRFRPVPDAGFRQTGYWQGVAVGDVDRDGAPDVFLSGFGCAALYLNAGGGRFRDVTAASGTVNPEAGRWETSAAFADVDRDGHLDLYVTCYVALGGKSGVCVYAGGVRTACSPTDFTPQRGTLYRNRGGGRFEDGTRAFGLDKASGNGLGVVFGDVNDDGYPDLYLANDKAPCDLFLNRAGRRFENLGVRSGTAFGPDGYPQAGMGADFGDYDGDGREDLVVTTFRHEPTSIYHNDGGGLFTNAAYSTHVGAPTVPLVGYGVKWTDLDNDGHPDLAISNGHPLHRIQEIEPGARHLQPFQVFHAQGNSTFREVTRLGAGLPRPLSGRALCTGDLDNDGQTDLLLSDIAGQPLLLRNVSPGSSHWLTLRLDRKGGNEGAVVTVRAAGRRQARRCTSGGSYLSASDPRVHFGLGAATTVDELTVRWPDGRTVTRRAVVCDRILDARP